MGQPVLEHLSPPLSISTWWTFYLHYFQGGCILNLSLGRDTWGDNGARELPLAPAHLPPRLFFQKFFLKMFCKTFSIFLIVGPDPKNPLERTIWSLFVVLEIIVYSFHNYLCVY